MSSPSLVAVYGLPVVDPEARAASPEEAPQPVRLGGGRLVDGRLVILDDEVVRQLRSDAPPEVLRVGIASRLDGEPFVEVIEVRQVVRAKEGRDRAAELWTSAASPTDRESQTEGDLPPGPANGWCYFFPSLSFC